MPINTCAWWNGICQSPTLMCVHCMCQTVIQKLGGGGSLGESDVFIAKVFVDIPYDVCQRGPNFKLLFTFRMHFACFILLSTSLEAVQQFPAVETLLTPKETSVGLYCKSHCVKCSILSSKTFRTVSPLGCDSCYVFDLGIPQPSPSSFYTLKKLTQSDPVFFFFNGTRIKK